MKCVVCGNEVDGSIEICPSCGTKIVKNNLVNFFGESDVLNDEEEITPEVQNGSLEKSVKLVENERESNNSIIVCNNCGSDIDSDSNSCPYCGSIIGQENNNDNNLSSTVLAIVSIIILAVSIFGNILFDFLNFDLRIPLVVCFAGIAISLFLSIISLVICKDNDIARIVNVIVVKVLVGLIIFVVALFVLGMILMSFLSQICQYIPD